MKIERCCFWGCHCSITADEFSVFRYCTACKNHIKSHKINKCVFDIILYYSIVIYFKSKVKVSLRALGQVFSQTYITFCELFSWADSRLLLSLYFAVGVCVLMLQEGWEATTAIYVVVQVVTTVGPTLRAGMAHGTAWHSHSPASGYGDVTVQNGSKIFMSLYVLTGTVLVANSLNHWVETLSFGTTRVTRCARVSQID